MGANDAAEMLEAAKAECVRLEAEVARLRGAAVITDPTDEEWVCQNCQTTLDLSGYNAAMFDAGRESVAPRITREELARAVCNGRYPDIYPDIVWRSLSEPAKEPYRRQADAVLSALGMTEEER